MRIKARTCHYCGRTGQKGFIQMHNGSWRCRSLDCQRQTRESCREYAKTDPSIIERAKRLRVGGLTYQEIADLMGGSTGLAWLRVNRK